MKVKDISGLKSYNLFIVPLFNFIIRDGKYFSFCVNPTSNMSSMETLQIAEMAGTSADSKLYPGLKQAYKCGRVKLIIDPILTSPTLLYVYASVPNLIFFLIQQHLSFADLILSLL